MTTTGGEIFEVIDAGLYSTLSSAPTLVNWCAGRVYSGEAPDGVAFPYLVFTYVYGGFTNTSPRADVAVMYQIECWALVQAEARLGAKHLYNVLQDQTLNLGTGWHNYYCRAIRWLNRPPETLAGKQLWRRGFEMDIRADKTSVP